METAKIFENGRSQAVRLPKKFRFNVEEVVVQQLGDAVILVPKEALWKTFVEGLLAIFLTMDEIRVPRMREIAYDLYAGYKHLYLCDEKKARKGVATIQG